MESRLSRTRQALRASWGSWEFHLLSLVRRAFTTSTAMVISVMACRKSHRRAEDTSYELPLATRSRHVYIGSDRSALIPRRSETSHRDSISSTDATGIW